MWIIPSELTQALSRIGGLAEGGETRPARQALTGSIPFRRSLDSGG